MRLRVHLRDRDPSMVHAWKDAFTDIDEVEVSAGDIFGPGRPVGKGVALVSPANSFGYMDGGIDLVYSQHFGWDLEKRLRERLMAEHLGELPVGQALIVPTRNLDTPWLVSAPTMRVPMDVARTANAFLAFRAALLAVEAHNRGRESDRIGCLYSPGLATANGKMPVERAAKQMRKAYDTVTFRARLQKGGLAGAVRQHMWLIDDST